ncbi:MAG: ATP synthase subunit A [miscellaneous Crenarchaeota group-6 archaeon AD8-1]|nr:MAG: ATP synthase subunit A [miscellaneous Crenarchaeota group-6 archaeon AD8-1]
MGRVSRVAGSFVTAKCMRGSQMFELVKVGDAGVIGEIIRLEGNVAVIQAYEETEGIKLGENVLATGKPLSVELGPGLIGQIFDGVQRPLTVISNMFGPFIKRGVETLALDPKKEWKFNPILKKGVKVIGGDIIGTVQETSLLNQGIMVPPNISGIIENIYSEGKYTIIDPIAKIKTSKGLENIFLMHTWPVRKPRPYKTMLPPTEPLLSGQRIIDSFFPIAKGGITATTGGFGTGKTVVLQTLAMWVDADVVVYIGCGERGNEMADVLNRFSKLKLGSSDHPLMDRTIFVANVSNMPIVAREASIYTGITLAEYYRDMGYNVALMADSTSRWAEALREISGRLEEMPGEEGYPAYLASRLAEFYARAGQVKTMGTKDRVGSITVLAAISPPGGDFSEPVTTNTLRIAKVFWALDFALAHRRHFPAINWFMSYSEYIPMLEPWFAKVERDWQKLCGEARTLLKEEEELREIVALIGAEILGDKQRSVFETAKMLKEYFLLQNAFHPVDAYCPIAKTYKMLRIFLKFYDKTKTAIESGVPLTRILGLPIREKLSRLKITPTNEFDQVYNEIDKEMNEQFEKLELKDLEEDKI